MTYSYIQIKVNPQLAIEKYLCMDLKCQCEQTKISNTQRIRYQNNYIHVFQIFGRTSRGSNVQF